MAGPYIYDRVKESTTTTGTGTLTLSGALTGFQSFSVVGNANTCIFCVYAVDANGNPSGDWEVSIGTYTSSGTTLSRTTVLASSNGGAAVNFVAGTKHVAIVHPADVANRFYHPTDTWANLAAYQAGRLLLPSDGFYLARDSGSARVPWGPIFPLTEPVSGDFAWINQGSATISTTNGGVYLEGPAEASAYNWRIRKKAAPATPYTITAAFLINADWFRNGAGSLNAFGALCFRQSSDGKLATLELFLNSLGNTLRVTKYTNATTLSATYLSLTTTQSYGPLIWFRIADNGTNRICSTSGDGQNWIEQHSVGRTDFLTADEVGFAVTGYTNKVGMTLLHWKQA